MEHPFNHYDNEEEDIIEALANRFRFSPTDKARYIDLLRIPFCQRTHEENESVERLIFLGSGISESDVERYQTIKCIPVAERTIAQKKFIVQIIQTQSRYEYPEQPQAPQTEIVRERTRNLLNHLAVFPQPFHDPAYNERTDNLNAALQEVLDT